MVFFDDTGLAGLFMASFHMLESFTIERRQR